ncbi:MAG: hypothetical protein HGA28_06380, partial [Anaerolineaceae bacterium]|nr:hypothetical protein [Anaerolineaceae bacterium]
VGRDLSGGTVKSEGDTLRGGPEKVTTPNFLFACQREDRTRRRVPAHAVKHPSAAGTIVELDRTCQLPGLRIFHQVHRPAVNKGSLRLITCRSIPSPDHFGRADIILAGRRNRLIGRLYWGLII